VANNVYEANTEAVMLGLTVKYGDLCVRTDRHTLFVYLNLTPPAAPPTVITDWKQVTWSDAQVVLNQAAMLVLTTSDPGDLVYDSETSELYIRINSGGDGSLITDWLKIASRPNIHLDVADQVAMLALPAEKGDLALRIDQDVTYALHANPATDILNWIQLPGGGAGKDIWVYSASTTANTDPGAGNVKASADASTPPIWTFEISATDSKSTSHNLSILKPRDTLVVADVPAGGGAPTFFQRFELLDEPTATAGWYKFTAKPTDVAVGTIPVVGSEIALEFSFGGGAIKVLNELDDVDTATTPPVEGACLVWDSAAVDSDGNVGQWVPTVLSEIFALPDPITTPPPANTEYSQFIVDTTTPLIARTEVSNEVYVGTTDPRTTQYRHATIWFDTGVAPAVMKAWNPTATPPSWYVVGANYLKLSGGTMTGNITFNGTNLGVNFTGGSGVYAWTDKPLTFRQGTNNSRPKIINNDGSNGREIWCTGASNININWLNGFSGTCQFRVNDAVVSCQILSCSPNRQIAENERVKMFDYPSGVPAPWTQLRVMTNVLNGLGWYENTEVQFNTDGVWLQAYDNRAVEDVENFSCTCTWAR
jgi:hypothetical protein